MGSLILLADDHPQVLANLRQLADEAGEVVGAVQDGRAVITEARRLQPDVIVLDLAMPEVSGLDVTRVLRREVPKSKVIICTVHTNARLIEHAFAAGAAGFVQKQSAHVDLVAAIRAVLSGDTFISPALRDVEAKSESTSSATESHEGGE